MNPVRLFGPTNLNSQKRRPAGVSRRDKHRRLQIETLEARQMMTATPISYDYDLTDVVMHDLLMDDQALRSLERASDLSQYSESQLASTTQWVVFTELGTDLTPYALEGGFSVTSATDIVPGSFIVTVGPGGSGSLISALSNEGVIDFFYPLVPFQLEETAITNDPLLDRQWHLVNYGQEVGNPNFGFLYGEVDEDINIEDAWDFYTGDGVVIGIVDSGVQLNHPDLIDNIREDLAINLAGFGNNPNPSGNDAHGTAVAGLAAGVGNNNTGITGVAYNSEIAPIRLFSDDPFSPIGTNDFSIAQALLHQFQEIDIYNHSWVIPELPDDQGVVENPRSIHDFGPLATLALRNSVFFGRGGLGSIHVFAAGNDSAIRDSGNNSGLVNSRYTIAVGGVIHDGTAASYAEAGAAILVVAPTGSNPETIIRDDALGSGLTTTDITGNAGFNQTGQGDADFLPDTDYSSRFNGTSAAAPIVSGVIALMLEANPNLTYRDVQHILVRSARQNDPTDASWITNVNEFFADPINYDSDDMDTIYDGAWPFFIPEAEGDPMADPPVPDSPPRLPRYQELRLPSQFTNGAGFTVSQMTTNTDYGYGHGVVDAAMAVELARNWVTVGGQQSEVTWTTGPTAAPMIQPGTVSDENTGEIRVPGGISPNGDGPLDEPNAFIDFFNEFGAEDDPAVPAAPDPDNPDAEPEDPDGPFTGEDPPVNTRDLGALFIGQNGLPITGVPAMTVEWIELQISIGGDENDMDFLRISIVSPDGTVSELKPYELPNVDNGIVQVIDFDAITDPAGVLSPDSGGLNAIYTTNRHWGERTEGKPRINTDGTPARAFNPDSGLYDGDIIVDGWRLVIENFSDSEMDILSYEIAFHGTDVTNTGRIQGAVGVDDNGDGFFSDSTATEDNFTRYIEEDLSLLPVEEQAAVDPRLSYQFIRGLNPDQESWAAGVIVYADLDRDGNRDATDPAYQVGADGNYFFDLPAGVEYQIRIDPTSLAAAGLFNQQNVDAVSAVLATATISVAGERVLANKVVSDDPSDSDTVDAAYGFSAGVISSVTDLNIVLVANAQPENVVDISGTVYADLNQNGIQDGNDAPIANATVFIDLNQNGVFTPGVDPIATTDGNGDYDFDDPFTADELLEIAAGFYTVRVLEGTTGTFDEPVNPDDASIGFFFAPELVRSDVDFGFISSGSGGGGPSGSVAISGVVFEDVNETGTRQAFEQGLSGSVATVYIDANNNNQFDAGEQSTTPAPNGSFVFNALPPGTYTIRIQFDSTQYRQTTPDGDLLPDGTREDEDDWEIVVSLTSGQIATGLLFGLKNNAEADWGDLPDVYGATTAAQNGARHIYDGNMFLGSTADLELNGTTSPNANFDDTNGIGDDEDGVTTSTLFDNSTTLTVTVTASTNGGWLQAWFDWNGDGSFSAAEKAIDNVLLPQGVNVIQVNVPTALLTNSTVFARFRYGEEGIDSIFGEALKGEVEDYAIPVVSTAIDPGVRIMHGPDFNEDGFINGRDFMIWQRGNGITSGATAAQGDADSDGDVDRDDLDMLQDSYGTTTNDPDAGVVHGADFNEDGIVNGRDFMIWQRGNGITSAATAAQGDADSDGDVDDDDLAMWRDEYGSMSTNGLSALSTGDGERDAFQSAVERLKQYRQQLIALPSSASQSSDSGAALGGTVEASARQSTFGTSLAFFLSPLSSNPSENEPGQVVVVEEIDAVFDVAGESVAPSLSSGADEVSYNMIDDSDYDRDEYSAFELAFADESGWSVL